MSNKQPVEIIEGEVTEAYPPNQNNDTGKWRPANIVIATDEGKVRLAQFPTTDKAGVTIEPIQMPEWYEALDLDNLPGVRVQAVAVYMDMYKDVPQYGRVQTFKILNGVAPKAQPKPTATTTTTASAPASRGNSTIDQRIAWNSALNNTVAKTSFNEDEMTWLEYWMLVDERAHVPTALIERGSIPDPEARKEWWARGVNAPLEPEDEEPFPNAPEDEESDELGVQQI